MARKLTSRPSGSGTIVAWKQSDGLSLVRKKRLENEQTILRVLKNREDKTWE